jgi:signal transduction histidine kinase/AmiR/NasT family two-component response regulator
VLPVLVVAAAVLAVILVVSLTVPAAVRGNDATVRKDLAAAQSVARLRSEIVAADAYAREVMSMTRLIRQSEVEKVYLSHTAMIEAELENLSRLGLPMHLQKEVTLLSRVYDDWNGKAVVLLGIRMAEEIPTLDVLEKCGALFTRQAGKVSAMASDHAAQTVELASAATSRTVKLVSGIVLIFVAAAILIAFRLAGRISKAMLAVTSRLRGLASGEADDGGESRTEIEAVFSALDTLEVSIQEKRKLTRWLKDEKIRAEAAAEAKSRFLATMSHEIRTPINGVLGMAEVLRSSGLTGEQKIYADTILGSSEALLSIVNDILDFSKLEQDKEKLVHQPFDLRSTVYDITALLSPEAWKKGLEICADVPSSIPPCFIGDGGRVRQILLNLAGNAVKFTASGHVAIRLDYDPERDLPLSILVEDSGIGIPEANREAVFNAFEQVDGTTARQYGGTGLGLAISARLAAAMGGRIDVESELGLGSCFALRLPLAAEMPAYDGSAGLPLSGRKAAVISALPVSREIRLRQLQSWGGEVRCGSAIDDLSSAVEKVVIAEAGSDPGLAKQISDALRCRSEGPDGLVVIIAGGKLHAALQPLKDEGLAVVLLAPVREEVLLRHLKGSALQASAGVPQLDQPAAPLLPGEFSGMRVLVAEDNRTNRLVLEKMLQESGAELVFCTDGQSAVDRFRVMEFDLVFMDISMPVLDGLQATGLIRAFEEDRGVKPCPVVALTADVVNAGEEACKAAGMSGFLSKPVRKAAITAEIRRWSTRTNDATAEPRTLAAGAAAGRLD